MCAVVVSSVVGGKCWGGQVVAIFRQTATDMHVQSVNFALKFLSICGILSLHFLFVNEYFSTRRQIFSQVKILEHLPSTFSVTTPFVVISP